MKPDWLKTTLPGGASYTFLMKRLKEFGLNTVCQESHCPNLGECFGRKTLTFLILGKICTRHCQFCSVNFGEPEKVKEEEPLLVGRLVYELNLNYVVITSVTRDDLDDGGAEQFAKTVSTIRKYLPQCRVELLIPDFQDKRESLDKVISVRPDVIGHNIETTRFLTKMIRDENADYDRSLTVLKYLKEKGVRTKSGLMVGLGESWQELIITLKDLKGAKVDIVTIGQYLPSTKSSPPVKKFWTKDDFARLNQIGREMGFFGFFASPLARSSYRADELFEG